MSYYHNVLIESTVQYSTVLVAGICLSILSCRLEMHAYDLTLKKKPFCFILLCGHYHGIITMDTEISLYCELENSVC